MTYQNLWDTAKVIPSDTKISNDLTLHLKEQKGCTSNIKSRMWQNQSWEHIQWWKTVRYPSQISNKTQMPTVTTPIQKARKLGKKKKYIPFGKEEVPSLFAEDMILYIENPKDSTKKTIINNTWTQLGCRTQSQYTKSVAFPFLRVLFFLTVDLQCSVDFCCTAKWYIYISPMVTHTHTYIYIHSFSHIILHHVPSQVTRYSSLCFAAGSHCLSTANVIVCIY